MSEALGVAAVVETLVDMDLVDLNGAGPWPGEPEGVGVYEPDWSQIHPAQPDMPTMDDMSLNPVANPRSVFEEVRRRAGAEFLEPPPDILDAQAWYTPLHYFGLGSAIYIREAAVLQLAAVILSRLEPAERDDDANLLGACRAAMSVLYLHEAFHHKIESMAIRFEIVERARRYLPYHRDVVIPLLRQGSDDVLEEALACAEMYRRFKTEAVYRRGVPLVVRRATLALLPGWFELLPPSYRQAGRYLSDGAFARGAKTLMCQVQEAITTPVRRLVEWDLAPHLQRGLFDCKRVTHVVVPLGERPLLPWIGHVPALPSVSTRKATRFLERQGWRIVSGRGKGSHIRMERDGGPPLTIPANRESLSPVVLKSIAGAMGVRIADLPF
jgi:predicted RNA binding protein YcfA (HicA-like mRNA interferase family)